MMTYRWLCCLAVSGSIVLTSGSVLSGEEPGPLDFTLKLEVVQQALTPEFCWFHPRAAAIPGLGKDGKPAVVMTLQKHLKVSDYYSGMWTMRTDDLGASWTGPTEIPELGWVRGDSLHFGPIRPWAFDDGAELGSYNTQQHWLVHSEGLFLAYTRRGANNDHIARHRAPLFLAQVDPERLCVLRSTEKVLIPERGAQMGNFGAAAISEDESWVTVSEYMAGDKPNSRGADGSTFVARVIWSRPNLLTRR